MTFFVVKREVLLAAYADPEYGPRLLAAETTENIRSILIDYCKAHGFKVKEVAG